MALSYCIIQVGNARGRLPNFQQYCKAFYFHRMHPQIRHLLHCIELEEKEEIKRYSLDQQHTLRNLKAEGLALHPLTITNKSFGYADYPEFSFRLNFPADTSQFRDGAAIECFMQDEEPVKGILLNLNGRSGECRLFAPDFPDWLEGAGPAIKLAPDQRTTTIMKTVLKDLEKNAGQLRLFEQLHEHKPVETKSFTLKEPLVFRNRSLNESQQKAVAAVLANDHITIVHGPPGTGKTTTLAEAIFQLVQAGEKVLVSAPGNTAVDHLARSLIALGLNVLRVGNASKVDETIFSHTPEGRMGSNTKQQKEIKELKIRAEQFRKMALKYKRSFGKAEREQRNLLFKEVKNIRSEIKKIQAYNVEKLYEDAQVVAGTPIGIYDAGLGKFNFKTLVMDEAGQCIEPLAWCIFPLAERYVLAGDHWQLPPTVLSNEAARKGLNRSILELCIPSVGNVFLLDTQYRMRQAIAGFSSSYFYNSLLQTAKHLHNHGTHISFIDTAGSGFTEKQGANGTSLQNEGELSIAQKLAETEKLAPAETAFISPYSGQVDAARELLPKQMRCSTIDSFQGQEKRVVILSLVRSNDEGAIGFLKDYRRMNVAITRAQEQLFVIGDSATIGADPFYNAFLSYVEKEGAYRTVWEFE